ncbi:MAG: type II toxin-antitoxin system MqsA family antitoxin [Thaumarchaeota archaeon]|nr:type II toxin-antitoxin system MqsA family antitoxin [Nitrososphaerota archaeon]
MKLGICPICGGATKEGLVDITESVKGKIVLIRDVKAEVCSQCGERIYSSSEIKKVEALLKKVKEGTIKPKETKKAEVYLVS